MNAFQTLDWATSGGRLGREGGRESKGRERRESETGANPVPFDMRYGVHVSRRQRGGMN